MRCGFVAAGAFGVARLASPGREPALRPAAGFDAKGCEWLVLRCDGVRADFGAGFAPFSPDGRAGRLPLVLFEGFFIYRLSRSRTRADRVRFLSNGVEHARRAPGVLSG